MLQTPSYSSGYSLGPLLPPLLQGVVLICVPFAWVGGESGTLERADHNQTSTVVSQSSASNQFSRVQTSTPENGICTRHQQVQPDFKQSTSTCTALENGVFNPSPRP